MRGLSANAVPPVVVGARRQPDRARPAAGPAPAVGAHRAFAWRARLAYDGELLGAVTRACVSTILGFYTARMKREGVSGGQSGAVVVVQRTSSDLKLNPHLHIILLDGVYGELDARASR
jgi:hypothetical protein